VIRGRKRVVTEGAGARRMTQTKPRNGVEPLKPTQLSHQSEPLRKAADSTVGEIYSQVF